MGMKPEFQEIGHCGGQFTVEVKTIDGERAIQLGYRGSRSVPMAAFGVYALPQGIPVGTMNLGGRSKPRPTEDSLDIFIASDSEGLFGHRCPQCFAYWRSRAVPAMWPLTCVNCGVRADTHHFLTEGQLKYVRGCCDLIQEAIKSEKDGESVIDMDQVADAVGKNSERPKFYYADVTQQNKFECEACGCLNDILGKYGYCSCCGTHNGLQELTQDISRIRDRIKAGQHYEACAKETVAAFDGFARQFSKEFAQRIPMIPTRQKEWERKLFHQLKSCVEAIESEFGINLFKGVKQEDIDFAILMFHRRHVYEHNAGEADQKYIDDTGDVSVKVKQALHETQESAHRIANIVLKVARNFQDGFHLIFPPEEKAILVCGRNVTKTPE
jgi:hypothetical protein